MRRTYLWIIHLATGVLIAAFLGVHMVIMHLDAILGFFGVGATEPTSWEPMIERAGQGIWVGLYVALLAFVLYHGLNGLRNVILELTPSAKTERIVTRVIIALGIVFFIGGTYVPVSLLTS